MPQLNPHYLDGFKSLSLLVIILFHNLTFRATSVGAIYLYVSPYGSDSKTCLSLVDSCRSLSHVINKSKQDDVILVDATDQSRILLCQDESIRINHSISIVGYSGHLKPGFGCAPGSGKLRIASRGARKNDIIQLRLEKMIINDILLDIGNTRLVFDDLELRNVHWVAQYDSYVGIYGHNVTMVGRGDVDTIFINVDDHVDFSLSNYTLANTNIGLELGSINLTLQHGRMINYPTISEASRGISVKTNRNTTKHSTIQLTDCHFEGLYSRDPVQAVQNVNNATFRIQTEFKNFRNKNVSVTVEGCQFINNERGLSFSGPYSKVRLTNNIFKDNKAMHAGAGINIFTSPDSAIVFVNNCSFINNSAGFYRPEIVTDNKVFSVLNNEAILNSECCKGSISLTGKGGGVRVQQGRAYISNCSFKSNTALLQGGDLYVDRKGNLTLSDITGENTLDSTTHPQDGEFIFSNGHLVIQTTKYITQSALSHVSIVTHSGDMWSLKLTGINISCPVGYMLRSSNATAVKLQKEGLERSSDLDQLNFFCESCPSNKYSIDYGYLNYNLHYANKSFYSLRLDGNNPQPGYNGTYKHQSIQCLSCPYGGKCHNELTPVANFWGYASPQHDGSVKFQRCPKGYCCSKADCKEYNSCKAHRTGSLCGTCERGYSEAMFTSDCVPNTNCDPRIGYPVMAFSGILYFVFLLFQKDIRDIMFTRAVLHAGKMFNILRNKKSKKVDEKVKSHPGDTENPSDDQNHDQGDKRETPKPYHVKNASDAEHLLEGGVCGDPGGDENLSLAPHQGSNGNAEDASKVEEKTGKLNDDKTEKPQPPPQSPPAPKPDLGVSFLIIIFFYFQDAQMLHIKTAFSGTESKYKTVLREILGGLFQFRVELFQFMEKFCFLEDMTALKKVVIRVGMVPCVLAQFGLVYIIYQCYRGIKSCRKSDTHESHESLALAEKPPPAKPPFSVKLATGFTLSLLFTYQQLASSSFTLLNCVPVGADNVLFIQGTETCYQTWQYGVMAYAGTCIVPFCLVLLLGPGLLDDRLIHLSEFFVASIIPLPFIMRWFCIRLKLYRNGSRELRPPPSPETKSVTQVLQGPFKIQTSRFFGKICGQGFLIGRRLILVLLYTFVNDSLRRMLCMLVLCFIILLHHVHVLPYKDIRGNAAGSMSAAGLLVLGAINLVRATFEAAEYVPHGPNAQLMDLLEELEIFLTLWLPGSVMVFILLMILIKICQGFCHRLRHGKSKDGGGKSNGKSPRGDAGKSSRGHSRSDSAVGIRLSELKGVESGPADSPQFSHIPPPPSPFNRDTTDDEIII